MADITSHTFGTERHTAHTHSAHTTHKTVSHSQTAKKKQKKNRRGSEGKEEAAAAAAGKEEVGGGTETEGSGARQLASSNAGRQHTHILYKEREMDGGAHTEQLVMRHSMAIPVRVTEKDKAPPM